VNWPGAGDPFWLNNTADNQAGINYYSVGGVPAMKVDGKFPASDATLPIMYNNRVNAIAHCTLDVSSSYLDSTRTGTVDVRITPDGSMPTANWVLRIALTVSGVFFNTPYNDYHYNVMFDMLPEFAGTPITLVGTTPDEVSYNFTLPELINDNDGLPIPPEDVKIVAWVQSSSTGAPLYREVYQAKSITLLDPTGVETVPAVFSLGANYPNPFNPKTTIPVTMMESGQVLVEVLSTDGRRVAVLHDGYLGSGSHDFSWNGTDQSGRRMASGVYMSKVTGSRGSMSQRMVLMK